MAVQAAVEGQGILIGHEILVARELEDGRLLAPFELRIPAPHDYVAIYLDDDKDQPHVAEFLHWLREEVA